MTDLITELDSIYRDRNTATDNAEKVLHDRQKAKQIAADANAVRLFELIPEIIDALMRGKQ